MKILIVEDEPKTGDYLQQGLAESSFMVDLARNGVDGLHLAMTGDYDLLVLDVMLPGMSGWQLLDILRQGGKHMPVMFLTARDQVEDRVKGLELGADDYLVKPFAFSEFLARVRTLLRRGKSGMESTLLRVADLELDLVRRRVVRGGGGGGGDAAVGVRALVDAAVLGGGAGFGAGIPALGLDRPGGRRAVFGRGGGRRGARPAAGGAAG